MKLFLSQISRYGRGFTLIELLVVIACIGILAAIVLLALNPAEQLARGRDASRQSAIVRLGSALQAYYSNNGANQYPVNNWAALNALVSDQDLNTLPVNPLYNGNIDPPAPTCALLYRQSMTTPASYYCYKSNGSTAAIIYARMESSLYNNKCPGTTPANIAWYVFSTTAERGGGICSSSEPAIGISTFDF